ncbi:TetR/AcrR family transcriptional regulator [Dactylosporangium vinaceum]|uniref:TetR/AcrR family transcriptional regulator n=1 Tax=Dactylosporangium vinaceum TaxID=53362 RepID=A0ABV5MSD7_9ACTN|nr:TetR/AcrR family transcriptional regulator [Dactylosporangium vinaceum]UAC00180.1 TetR/AcrR family transcriptional regulator [Dactylosporangium vinaceum]
MSSQRSYDNSRRAELARLTRRRILDATRDLVIRHGPAAVTMRVVATHAAVSVETVQKAFRTKAVLLKEAYDVTLAGDDEPIAMIDRPEIQAVLAATTPREKLARYATFARVVGERTGPLLSRLLAGSHSGDPDLADFRDTVNRERLLGVTGIVGHLAGVGGLRAGLPPERARDITWALISPELYELFVIDRGWTSEQYEQWLAQALVDALAP